MATITIYGKPDATCFACKKTKGKFEEAGVSFVFVDITLPENAAALSYVTDELGYSQAPVVVVDEHDHWSGLDPVNIARITTNSTI